MLVSFGALIHTQLQCVVPGNFTKFYGYLPHKIDGSNQFSIHQSKLILYVTFPDSKKILDRARSIEKAVFAVTNKTDNAYKFKIRSLYLNLKDPKNPNLRRSVLNGDLSPEALSTMTTQEMASSEQKVEIERIQRENMDNAMAPQAVKSTTDQFPCGKCGQKKVAYTQAQTRSADEPMTTFCECVSFDKSHHHHHLHHNHIFCYESGMTNFLFFLF